MFEMRVSLESPLLHEDDLDYVLVHFLVSIGYLEKVDPQRDYERIKTSVGYRLFRDCFLRHPQREWSPDEMVSFLKTTKPTLYRHLNKLKSMDILEDISEGKKVKYRLKYGSLSRAWNFVEVNVKMAMENYRKMVEHIEKLAGEGGDR